MVEEPIDDLPPTQPVPIGVDDPKSDQVYVDVRVLAAVPNLPDKIARAAMLAGAIRVMHSLELNIGQAKRLMNLKGMKSWNSDPLKVA